MKQDERGARERKSQIDGTMISREGREIWGFGADIVPRLFHDPCAGRAGILLAESCSRHSLEEKLSSSAKNECRDWRFKVP